VLAAVAAELETIGGADFAMASLLVPGCNPAPASRPERRSASTPVCLTLADFTAKWRGDLATAAARGTPQQHIPPPLASDAKLPSATAPTRGVLGPSNVTGPASAPGRSDKGAGQPLGHVLDSAKAVDSARAVDSAKAAHSLEALDSAKSMGSVTQVEGQSRSPPKRQELAQRAVMEISEEKLAESLALQNKCASRCST
jgi:hypothetical protein